MKDFNLIKENKLNSRTVNLRIKFLKNYKEKKRERERKRE